MIGRPKLVLASGSPRRVTLINQAGIEPDALRPTDIDETPKRGELPRACANRLARAKAEAALTLINIDEELRGAYILSADTVVAVGRRILPKADLLDEAAQCLRLLSGRNHRVHTAVCLVTPAGAFRQRLVETKVRFKRLNDEDIEAYLASGEWRGKAGAYAAQGIAGLVARKKYVYLCTNALVLEKHLQRFTPSPYLTLSVHLDGLRERHDELVCREGTFDIAVSAITTAKAAGFRVTTNTTVFEGEHPEALRKFFDFTSTLGIDGMMVSPGYSYEKAPDQQHFLKRERTKELFRKVFSGKKWDMNHSPFFLEFLQGKHEYQCTPWGNPNYSVLGWQKPCYLMADGYAQSYQELMDTTEWDRYGTGRDPRCAD